MSFYGNMLNPLFYIPSNTAVYIAAVTLYIRLVYQPTVRMFTLCSLVAQLVRQTSWLNVHIIQPVVHPIRQCTSYLTVCDRFIRLGPPLDTPYFLHFANSQFKITCIMGKKTISLQPVVIENGNYHGVVALLCSQVDPHAYKILNFNKLNNESRM
jgi:hypothetical protein